MRITEAISFEFINDPIFAQELIDIKVLLKLSSCVTIVYGRANITEERYDGKHTLFYPSSVPFVAKKTKSGIMVEYYYD